MGNRNQNQQNRPQNQPQNMPPGPEQTPEPEIPADVEDFLSDFGGAGHKVMLYRTAPLNCSGFLETYPCDSSLTMEAIRESWGGRDFTLKLKGPDGKIKKIYTIKIADVPRVNSIPLSRHIEYAQGGQSIKHDPATDLVKDMNAQLAASQEKNTDLLLKMMDQQSKHAQALIDAATNGIGGGGEDGEQMSPLEQMRETFALFNEMKDFTQEMGGGELGGKEEMGISDMFSFFKSEWEDRKTQQRQQTGQRPPLKLPGGGTRPPRQNPQQAPAQAPQQAPAQPVPDLDDEDEGITLAEELGELGPQGAAAVVAEVMESFNPLEQKAALDALFAARANPGNPVDTDNNAPDTDLVQNNLAGGHNGEETSQETDHGGEPTGGEPTGGEPTGGEPTGG